MVVLPSTSTVQVDFLLHKMHIVRGIKALTWLILGTYITAASTSVYEILSKTLQLGPKLHTSYIYLSKLLLLCTNFDISSVFLIALCRFPLALFIFFLPLSLLRLLCF